ncbi:hypothetical protein L6452_09694 [Arctium lappa]|uniref:Uncharacterized protein n=1 Tax=Arctium lappa TaxID=4217 RepID=A0ACB9DL67_ARCLA|nr:hypothetical protein L6452_09694 [Arctium lappa]
MLMIMNESLDAEKQVSVDPISMTQQATHRSWSSPVKPLPLLPTKYKFLSTTSLPISPRIASSKIRPTDHHTPNPTPPPRSPTNTRLQRSKSGGEHRSSVPYSSFDTSVAAIICERRSSTKPAGDDGQDHRITATTNEVIKPNNADSEFKCGALCLFLPGFGKGKQVRARRVEPEGTRNVISQRVSLEKFECGSWRSSAIQSDDDQHSSTLYFDLPLELIRTNVNDTSLPMNSAFVFNKSAKGVLKTTGGGGASAERKSQEGCRRVRFSTSDPPTQPTSPSSCITPRLRKAREDFNAFLEAQSA